MTAQSSVADGTRENATPAKGVKFSTNRSTRFSTAGHPDLPKAQANPDRVGWCTGIED